MFDTLNKDEIEEVLKEQSVGRIGCHASDKTYVVPIGYFYDGKSIYCHAHEGLKIHMMRQNSKVCFEVDAFGNNGKWKSVIGWGEFEEITNEKERGEALKLMLGKELPFTMSKTIKLELGSQYPFVPDDLNKIHGVVFRINLTEKTGRFERNDTTWSTIQG